MQEANIADKILRTGEMQNAVSGGIVYPSLFNDNINDLANQILCPVEKEQGEEAQPTNQIDRFVFPNQATFPPVDICAARKMKDISPHHASCIQSKKYATLGLGFVSDAAEVEASKKKPTTPNVEETEARVASLLTGETFIESKVDKILDPLTMNGFMFELFRAYEDNLDGGTGYLEIVRNSGFIVGINWLPYEDLQVIRVRDNQNRTRVVYKYIGSAWGGITSWRYYSTFGLANRRWVYDTYYKSQSNVPIETVSEVIPLMTPSNRSRHYGYPEWLSASTLVTLVAMSMQYKSDFYTNKGVLSYILSIMGSVDADKWKVIENLIQGSIGAGNNFKNLAIQVPEGSTVQVDKMTSTDKTEMQFSKDMEVYATNIVSAHRVPPVLANILISGKLGAANETVQAIIAFQLLNIGPRQNMIQKTLARTLAGPEGIAGLTPEDFRLIPITSQFDIQGLDTMARAREEIPGSGRDVSQGLKD